MFLRLLFRLQKKNIIRIFVSGNSQFGLKQIIQTQVFDRNTVVIMDHCLCMLYLHHGKTILDRFNEMCLE